MARTSTDPVPPPSVHPDVWADALRQADGDPARIEIVSRTSVVIHNRPNWQRGRSSTGETLAPAAEPPAAAAAEPNAAAAAASEPAKSVASKPSEPASSTAQEPAATERRSAEPAPSAPTAPARPTITSPHSHPATAPTPVSLSRSPVPQRIPSPTFVAPTLDRDDQ